MIKCHTLFYTSQGPCMIDNNYFSTTINFINHYFQAKIYVFLWYGKLQYIWHSFTKWVECIIPSAIIKSFFLWVSIYWLACFKPANDLFSIILLYVRPGTRFDLICRVVKMIWSSRRMKISRRHWGPKAPQKARGLDAAYRGSALLGVPGGKAPGSKADLRFSR